MYTHVTVLFLMLANRDHPKLLSRVRVTLDGIFDFDQLKTQLIITLNYNTIANFYTLQITSAHAKSFLARSVFTRRFLIMASNNGYSSVSVVKSWQNGCSLPTACLPYNWLAAISHQPPSLLFTANQLTTELQLSLPSQTDQPQSQSQCQSQSYFTTGVLALISSSWRQAPSGLWPEIFFFNWTLAVIVLM
jgi:hypothetical protein